MVIADIRCVGLAPLLQPMIKRHERAVLINVSHLLRLHGHALRRSPVTILRFGCARAASEPLPVCVRALVLVRGRARSTSCQTGLTRTHLRE